MILWVRTWAGPKNRSSYSTNTEANFKIGLAQEDVVSECCQRVGWPMNDTSTEDTAHSIGHSLPGECAACIGNDITMPQAVSATNLGVRLPN
jgi:hypothetical protein